MQVKADNNGYNSDIRQYIFVIRELTSREIKRKYTKHGAPEEAR